MKLNREDCSNNGWLAGKMAYAKINLPTTGRDVIKAGLMLSKPIMEVFSLMCTDPVYRCPVMLLPPGFMAMDSSKGRRVWPKGLKIQNKQGSYT